MDFSVELDQSTGLAQGEERMTVFFADGRRDHMRLHEYGRMYAVPGLYEEVVQRRLECASPTVLATALVDEMARHGEGPSALRVLDVGAGNGVVGEELRRRGVKGSFVGIDNEPGAAIAAERDRPGLYVDYLFGELAELSVRSVVAQHNLTGLVGAGALGPGHISASCFDAAWREFPRGAWLAVTMHEDVLMSDGCELGEYIAALRAGGHNTEVIRLNRFRHRLRMSGEPIHYFVMIARRTA